MKCVSKMPTAAEVASLLRLARSERQITERPDDMACANTGTDDALKAHRFGDLVSEEAGKAGFHGRAWNRTSYRVMIEADRNLGTIVSAMYPIPNAPMCDKETSDA